MPFFKNMVSEEVVKNMSFGLKSGFTTYYSVILHKYKNLYASVQSSVEKGW